MADPRFTGWTLGDHPYEIGRVMLFTVNILPLVLMYVLIGRLVERFGTTDWGRIFVMAAATLGTFLNTFAVVLNNHIVAAVSAAVALYAAVRIAYDGERRLRYFVARRLRGRVHRRQRAARAYVSRLIGLLLLWTRAARNAARIRPGSARRGGRVLRHQLDRPRRACGRPTCTAARPSDNWYTTHTTVNGRAIKSYWLDRQGIDRGEPTKLAYAVHVLVGHHGMFSLTPIWLLSIAGALMWLWSPDASRRQLAAVVLLSPSSAWCSSSRYGRRKTATTAA